MTLLTLVVTTAQVFARMKISKQQMELGSKESGMSYGAVKLRRQKALALLKRKLADHGSFFKK